METEETDGGLVAILGGTETSTTNATLDRCWGALGIESRWLTSLGELETLRRGDTVVARVDVRASLDGVEPGLLQLLPLLGRGVRVVNRPGALLAAHDKLITARRLVAAGLPHPTTVWTHGERAGISLKPPVVVKPRFGSWGTDVALCGSREQLGRTLAGLCERQWFRRHGALVQRLVPPRGYDLRLLVAGGRVVGAIRRRARPGEWRTNYSLGGTLERVVPPPAACLLAAAAAATIGADFVGVDLLPEGDGYTVLELNGAVDFEPSYALPGENVYDALATALALPRRQGRVDETLATAVTATARRLTR